ncbi:hypothetical protein HaLaN_09698, partial [Haematococcus lacustris]
GFSPDVALAGPGAGFAATLHGRRRVHGAEKSALQRLQALRCARDAWRATGVNMRLGANGDALSPAVQVLHAGMASDLETAKTLGQAQQDIPNINKILHPSQRGCVGVGATRGTLATSTHTRMAKLKWASGALAVA